MMENFHEQNTNSDSEALSKERGRFQQFLTIQQLHLTNAQYYFRGQSDVSTVFILMCIPIEEQTPYFGRKKYCTFNVMAVCDFDMYFMFISACWEGSAHDARVFDHAVKTLSLNFPHPPPERYYLVDKGYPDRHVYMVPYSKVNYHRSEFGRELPKNQRERFNRINSSLRTTIERCFGVMKKRWKILKHMPGYSIETQVDIVLACFRLHNFILSNRLNDESFEDDEIEPKPIYNPRQQGTDNAVEGMKALRDRIAREIWSNKRAWLNA